MGEETPEMIFQGWWISTLGNTDGKGYSKQENYMCRKAEAISLEGYNKHNSCHMGARYSSKHISCIISLNGHDSPLRSMLSL